MKISYILATLLVALTPLPADVVAKAKAQVFSLRTIQQLHEKGEYKSAISQLEELIQKQPTSENYLLLAVSYLLDQQEELALKTYLICLEKAPVKKGQTPSAKEQAHYNELIALYLDTPQQLEAKLRAVMQEYPDFSHCQFFLASSFANAHKYEPFFYLFYQSYMAYPDSHMAHKTKGVVASLLFQQAITLEEKNKWRKQALDYFSQALNVMPQDRGLQKMMIITASEKERKEIVHKVLELIITHDAKIPRGEIPFYINHAIWVNEFTLAQSLIDNAKSWYQYSRVLQDMQQLIDQHKQKN